MQVLLVRRMKAAVDDWSVLRCFCCSRCCCCTCCLLLFWFLYLLLLFCCSPLLSVPLVVVVVPAVVLAVHVVAVPVVLVPVPAVVVVLAVVVLAVVAVFVLLLCDDLHAVVVVVVVVGVGEWTGRAVASHPGRFRSHPLASDGHPASWSSVKSLGSALPMSMSCSSGSSIEEAVLCGEVIRGGYQHVMVPFPRSWGRPPVIISRHSDNGPDDLLRSLVERSRDTVWVVSLAQQRLVRAHAVQAPLISILTDRPVGSFGRSC